MILNNNIKSAEHYKENIEHKGNRKNMFFLDLYIIFQIPLLTV